MTGVRTIRVASDETDLRLDRWFRRHFPNLKHGELERLLRTGQVRVNGRRVKSGHRLTAEDAVRIPPRAAAAPGSSPADDRRHLSDIDKAFVQGLVLHRDDHVIALNKPSGLAVQGGTATLRHLDALLNGLKYDKDVRPRLVHRLDKDTSGVLLLARSANAAAGLAEAFRDKSARKSYWALVVGVPEPQTGIVESALAKGGGAGRELMAVVEHGRHAQTRYRVVDTADGFAWLEMMPITGRTHQLRVHALQCGTPIVGDRKYGGSRAVPERDDIGPKLHLHARAIEIPHPAGGRLKITAPLPAHMVTSWQALGFET
ncbi:MAG: RluA family pseudouridine synthase [Alphaproteobacteria bacterium]|nr:RluA family pseudouridine synthase [Alphaproteobacteria bacterium]